jgi:DNA modification methylase
VTVPHGASEHDIQSALTNCAPALADDASVYVIHDDADTIKCRQAYENTGYYLSGTCIWERPAGTADKSKKNYVTEHTPVLYGWAKKGRHRWYADRRQVTVWDILPVDNGDFPVALMGYPILNSTMTNGVVLAPFGGYGAVLLAAEQTGRICMMAEQQEKISDVVVARYINMTEDESVFVIRDGEKRSYGEVRLDA